MFIETEHEHDINDSRDAMLEAENDVIRETVQRGGIVWPGAFRALGLLKEKENHHVKPDTRGAKYSQVLRDGKFHATNSWVRRCWPFQSGSEAGKRVSRRTGWRSLAKRVAKEGKKNFVQALIAWALVALLFVKALQMHTFRGWGMMSGIIWVSCLSKLVGMYRQYGSFLLVLLHSPARGQTIFCDTSAFAIPASTL